MTTPQDDFGTLRSLLATGLKTSLQRRTLMVLLDRVEAQNPSAYQDKWIPYLNNSSITWHEPFLRLDHASKLKRYTQLVPKTTYNIYAPKHTAEELRELISSPLGSAIHTIYLTKEKTAFFLDALCSSPHLTNLKQLNVSLPTDEDFRTLYRAETLNSVNTLGMHAAPLTDDAFEQFAASPRAATLTGFGLGATTLSSRTIRALADSSIFPGFHWVNLASTNINANDIIDVSKAGLFNDAEYLQLSTCKLGNKALNALGEYVTSLGHLDVVNTNITKTGLAKFLRQPLAKNLESINLSSNDKLEDVLGEVFVNSPTLDLKGMTFHSAGGPNYAKQLAKSKAFQSIKKLAIWSADLDDEQLLCLLDAPWIDGIEQFELGFNNITEEGLIHLANHPHMHKLQNLYLSSLSYSEQLAHAIANSPHMSSLETLWCDPDKLGDEGLQALKASPFVSDLLKFTL